MRLIKHSQIDSDITTRCPECNRRLDYINLVKQVSSLVDDFDLDFGDVIDVDIEVNCKNCKKLYIPVLITRVGDIFYVKQQ